MGILAITRKRQRIGGFVLAGCLLLMLDPMAEMVIFNILLPNLGSEANYEIFNWAYACVSAPATALGMSALLAAIYMSIQPKPASQTGDETADENAAVFAPKEE
jgi:hypothetical protein